MEIIYITILAIIASGVGTLTGFGTSTIMVPVLLLFLPLPQTLFLVGIIHWFGNIWKILFFKKGFNWRLVLTFGLPGILFSYIGASIIFRFPESLMVQVLGVFFIAYVIFLFFYPGFKIPGNSITAFGGGSLSGFFAGLSGVGGAVRGMFLSAFDLPKAVYISTAGAIALFIDSARIITYFINQAMPANNILWGLMVYIPASYAGAALAKKIIDKIPQQNFRLILGSFLFLIGIKFLLFP